MTETHARIRFRHGDQVDESIIALPLKTGDEAFRFLEVFEQKCGGPVKDAARDRRYAQIERERRSSVSANQPRPRPHRRRR